MPYRAPNYKPRGKPRSSYDAERGSAASRGYGSAWRKKRASYLRRNPLCVACLAIGRTTPATEVDHVVPLRDGGPDKEFNYQPLCKPHHSQKTAAERCK